jgi:hypothetical protein
VFESWWTSDAKYYKMHIFDTCMSPPTRAVAVVSAIDTFSPRGTTTRDVTVVVEYQPELTTPFEVLSVAAEQATGTAFQSLYCAPCESTVTVVSVDTAYSMADARRPGAACSSTKKAKSDKSDSSGDSQASTLLRPVTAVTVAAVVATIAFAVFVLHRRAVARRASNRVRPFNEYE